MKNKLLTILSIFCIAFMALGLTACGGGSQDPVKVTGVTISESSQTLEVGESFSLQATVNPSNADNKSVSWSSSNTSVASVSNGSVTAIAKGTATITVTTVDGNFTASCAVTVTEPEEPDEPSNPDEPEEPSEPEEPEEHVHEYSEEVTEPTCTARGYTTYTCKCGDTYVSNYVKKASHVYTNYVYNNDATCTLDGTETAKCDNDCGQTNTRTKEDTKIAHTIITHAGQANTCTDDGWLAYETCENCDYSTYEVIPADHDYITHEGQPVTCTENGWAAYETCSRCEYSTYREIPACHLLNYHEAKAPTCTEIGWDEYDACTRCDYSTIVEIPALGHKHLAQEAETNYRFRFDGEFVGAGGGDYTGAFEDWFETTNKTSNSYATLTITAERNFTLEYKISVSSEPTHDKLIVKLNNEEIERISGNVYPIWYSYSIALTDGDVLTFTYSKDGSVNKNYDRAYIDLITAATIEEIIEDITPEYIASLENVCQTGLYCCVCEETVVEPGTHTIVNHEAKAPTCTEIGWEAYETCSRCDYTTYAEIPALNHDLINHDAQTPTCTDIGWEAYETCSRCDYTTYEEIPITHDLVEHQAQEATCTEIGWNAYQTCSSCEYTTYEEIPALGHDYIDHQAQAATCTEIGWNAYQTCSRCDYTAYEEIPALGHDYINHEAQAPTCTEVGFEAYETCSRCDYTTYVEIPVNSDNHDVINHQAQAATCTEIGWNAYETCSRCDYTTYEEISLIPHTAEEWDVLVTATCSSYGERKGTCTVCEQEFTETYIEDCDYVDGVCTECAYKQGSIGLDYVIEDGYAYVTGIGSCTDTEIVIPNRYYNYLVAGIKSQAFSNCNNVTSIEVQNNVTGIEIAAFESCSSLESITLPFVGATLNGTENTHFGYIFGASTYLENVNYVPALLKTVVFNGGEKLEHGAFYNCSSIETVVIPNSITFICDNVFYDCSSLKNVNIPDGVTSIGEYAFNNCSSLTSIEIPSSVTSIEHYAFKDCSSLESITLPFVGASITASNGYDQVFGYIFGYTTSSSESNVSGATYQYGSGSTYYHYYIPYSLKTVELTNITTMPYNAFYNCSTLTSIEIPNSVTSIGINVFARCYSLTSIEIPSSVTSIGGSAFYDCNKLTKVNYLGTIDEWVQIEFGNSSANPLRYAKNLYINGKLVSKANITTATKISNYAFYYCTSLTSIEISNSVTSIGNDAFCACSKLTKVNYLGTIDEWASITFSNRLANPIMYSKCLYINNSLNSNITVNATNITEYAFVGWSSLTSVTVGESTESIGLGAFSGCSGLKSLTIPFVGGYDAFAPGHTTSTLKTLFGYIFGTDSYSGGVKTRQGYGTFNSQWNDYYIPEQLQTVTITKGYKISTGAFSNCKNIKTIIMPDELTHILCGAFYNCSSLQSVTINKDVYYIEPAAFEGCSNLRSAIFKTTNYFKMSIMPPGYSSYDILTSGELSNPSTAATYLTTTYVEYYWY